MTMMKADGSFAIGCGKKERLLGKSVSPNQLILINSKNRKSQSHISKNKRAQFSYLMTTYEL
jgi:hypothetical protein